ncbi:MAG TPA: DNRLRE domain-containing protein [Anaerolineae bacterium]|nr:DNRLRE domain-containing protein [Anaerolineae bacterium]
MKKSIRSRLLTVLLVLGLVVPLLAAPVAAAPSQAGGPGRTPSVRSASDSGLAKMHPDLRASLSAAKAGDEINVIVYAKAGTDLSSYMSWSLVRPFVYPDGTQAIAGAAKATALRKLASLDTVRSIRLMENPYKPPQPVDPDVPSFSPSREAIQSKLAVAKAGVRGEGPTPSGEVSPEAAGWFDVLDGHKSKAAWEKGFTGAGVKVMVNDSGVDFCHPDLEGTQARVTDPSSPYYGWPEMFDSFSMYYWAVDQYLGYNFVGLGYTDYADTSTVVTGTLASYQPIGASESHVYTLTGTSVSGEYHIGSHPDKALQAYWYDERVAVLVVDEHEAGVYDTVYVDLDDDYDFTDEKPVRWGDETACRDLNDDGYNDVSGGLVYFIADGVNPIPASDWLWGLGVAGNGEWDFGEPANGSLVAFLINDFTEPAGDHGQLCASNVAGQGVIDGDAPPWKPAGDGTPFTGMVQGGGRDVGVTANGNFYISPWVEDGFLFSILGYDGIPGTEDDVQIITNSWGESGTHNDGWDGESRLIDNIQRINPTLSVLVSTGNGAAGYGTVTSPNPPGVIGVGASTQYGSTGTFDSIMSMDQMNWGDIQSWSNRGPGARGDVGVHVTANGAWGAGALPLNEVGDGWYAWELWGGTSRSSPVAAGNLALVYDAYKQANGVWPDYETARAIYMAGADNAHYDVLNQGAGVVNADKATDIAGGLGGVYMEPAAWQVGDYRGMEWTGFANIIHPGQSDTQTFTVVNPGNADAEVSISDSMLTKFADTSFEWTSKDQSLEEGSFTRSDYLFDITDMIPEGTDLMEVKVVFPFDEFDPDGDYDYNQRWRVRVLDWTDVNGDGNLWEDLNGNGVVNCPDGLGSDTCEIDEGEYIRFQYGYNSGTALQARVKRPLERMHDGIFLGFRHWTRDEAIPITHLKVKINFYREADWGWAAETPMTLTVPAGGTATFDATVSVPATAAYGTYEGAIVVTTDGKESLIPVVVNVAAYSADFTFGGPGGGSLPYVNGQVNGYFTWAWRAESGDWRFFFVDVPEEPAPGTSLLVDTRWENPQTDIDTIVMGPTMDDYSFNEPDYYGPYTLDIVGGSSLNYLGSGKWLFQTSTGGPRDITSAPLTEGLHLIAMHNVLYADAATEENFVGQAGTITADPASYAETVPGNGSFGVTVQSSLPLPGLVAEGFGLGAPVVYTDQVVNQDDPNDPSTASYTRTLTINHGALLEVSTGNSPGNDLDLYLYYDADGDGVYETLMGSSTTPTDEEFVSVMFPPDGNYLIAVHGWSVPTGTATFDLTVKAVQGYDLAAVGVPAGPFAPGTPINFDITYDVSAINAGETGSGLVLLGPPGAPGAVAIEVDLTKDYTTPASVTLNPTDDATVDYWAPDTNYGSAINVIIRQFAVKDAAINFDLSGIDPNYPVDEAKLYIYTTGSTNPSPLTVTAYPFTEAWDEGTITAAAAPAADYDTPLDTVTVAGPGWVVLDVTAWAQMAVADPDMNFGLDLVGEGSQQVEYYFLTKEFGDPMAWPRLEVKYRTP